MVLEAPENGLNIVLEGDLSELDGTVLSIRGADQGLLLAVQIYKNSQIFKLSYGGSVLEMALDSNTTHTLAVHERSLRVVRGEEHLDIPADIQHTWSTWRGGLLAVGGLFDKGEGTIGSNFLTGCLENISVQGKQLDLDLANKDMSISSHSCPA